MAGLDSPVVLFLDDNVEELEPLARAVQDAGAAKSEVVFPGAVTEEHLRDADLVIVDYTIGNWTDNEKDRRISLLPKNGVALAAVLRQYSEGLKTAPPTGYSLITADPRSLGAMPAERRPHVISRLTNLEWFFDKRNGIRDASRIVSLGSSVRALPIDAALAFGTIDGLVDILGVPAGHPLRPRFEDDVARCRPPMHHIAERSHGLIILRWLLHRILPHTCFLLDQWHLAARLRVTPDSLSDAMANNKDLGAQLAEWSYRGPLADFDGPRWWRSGVEQWLWNGTGGQSADDDAVLRFLNNFAGGLKPLQIRLPVVTIDSDFNPVLPFVSFDDVVAVHLDDWPSYAEPAYVTKQMLEEHSELNAYVVSF